MIETKKKKNLKIIRFDTQEKMKKKNLDEILSLVRLLFQNPKLFEYK